MERRKREKGQFNNKSIAFQQILFLLLKANLSKRKQDFVVEKLDFQMHSQARETSKRRGAKADRQIVVQLMNPIGRPLYKRLR